jgi:hypothetical protein
MKLANEVLAVGPFSFRCFSEYVDTLMRPDGEYADCLRLQLPYAKSLMAVSCPSISQIWSDLNDH